MGRHHLPIDSDRLYCAPPQDNTTNNRNFLMKAKKGNKKLFFMTLLVFNPLYAQEKVAISDTIPTKFLFEAPIQSLTISNKHFELEVKKTKLNITAKSSNAKDATLVIVLTNGKKMTFNLFFSREEAKSILNFIPKLKENIIHGNFDANFQKLIGLPHNMYVVKKLGEGKVVLNAFFWVEGNLYLKMVVPNQSAEVEVMSDEGEYLEIVIEEKSFVQNKVILLKIENATLPLKLMVSDSEEGEEVEIKLKRL